jgi:hypothetical protein
MTLMDEGKNLVIAPEGTRSRTGALIEGKPGVSYLATRLGEPIVPVAITGTEDKVIFGNLKRLRRSHITLTAGTAFNLPPLPRQNREEILKQYTDEIMCRIAALLPEKHRGVYKDHPIICLDIHLREQRFDLTPGFFQVRFVALVISLGAIRPAVFVIDQDHPLDMVQPDCHIHLPDDIESII